ncbi:MAG TPA: copper chaperone PCu(A)C [Intrasporangium sp.]|nr:copper chaperone PCu(A)C [Intrasporangium sp.]
MNRAPSRPAPRLIRSAATTTATLVAALTIASCGTQTADSTPSPTAPAASGAVSSPVRSDGVQPGTLVLQSGWAKAGAGMTAVFGTVVNGTARDVTIVGGTSPSAGAVQVHTMAKQPDGSMKMTQLKAGLTVPAGGSAELAPGADHIMLVELRAPLANGEDVSLAIATADGSTLDWTVPVRSFAGAEETYVPEDH